MTTLDWIIVAGLNVLVFGYAVWRARQTTTGEEWFVGGRVLPFWVVGLSMFATSADGGEYVSVNGQTYEYGIAIIAGLMLGAVIGAVVSSFWVAPGILRTQNISRRAMSRQRELSVSWCSFNIEQVSLEPLQCLCNWCLRVRWICHQRGHGFWCWGWR